MDLVLDAVLAGGVDDVLTDRQVIDQHLGICPGAEQASRAVHAPAVFDQRETTAQILAARWQAGPDDKTSK